MCGLLVCGTVDAVSPSSSTSEFPALDSDRDTTFDDFDLEHDERLEVAEMFGSSRSLQGRRGSEGDADSLTEGSDNSSHLSINIPPGYTRSLRSPCFFTRAFS